MISKRKKQKMFEEIDNKGKDLENKNYVIDKITHPHYKIERHERADSPYDRKRTPRFGKYKKTDYIETKGTTAPLSKPQKQFQKEHPRSFKVERGETDSAYHNTMNAGRKIRKWFS